MMSSWIGRRAKKSLFFSPLGKDDRTGNARYLDLDLHTGLGICHIHNVASHLYDSVAPLGDRLDLDIHDLTFFKVLGYGFGAGFSLSYRAVTPTRIAAEQHYSVILDKTGVGFTAFGADHVIFYVTLDDHLEERDLKLTVKYRAVAINLSRGPQLA